MKTNWLSWALHNLLAVIHSTDRDGCVPYEPLAPSERTSHLPNITIIATGGTIAGATSSPEKTTDYKAGVLQIEEVIRSVEDQLRGVANVYVDQFSNIDSININSSFAINLSHHIAEELNKEATQGVVVTTGTHSLAYLAEFLSLVLSSKKPIVVTGARRPHGSLGADGPSNLLAAVTTAATRGWSSENHNVVIVIQDKVMASRGTKKEDDQFLPGPRSLLGDIKDSKPFLRWLPGPCAPVKFNISSIPPGTSLPRVELLPVHQDFGADLVEAAIGLGAKGLVMVAHGGGYWPETSALQIKKLTEENGVIVILANQGQSEYVANARSGFGIPGGDWIPDQVRLVLQLLLWGQAKEEEIQRVVSMGSNCPCFAGRRSVLGNAVEWIVSHLRGL
ncbi:Asparaginase [Fusarium sp. LHS14.1]|nr:Asparaginase [Fusarium sp. LHS14.1]